jgi:hypothetical protein
MQNGPPVSKADHTGFYLTCKLFTQTFWIGLGDATSLHVAYTKSSAGTVQNNLGSFLLLNPDFFFWCQRASAKGSARAFFGVVFMTFFFSKLFFDLRRISVRVFSELKIPKSEGHLLKPGKLGPLLRKVG